MQSIDGEVVQKQRLDIKLPLLCRISPQCVHGAPVRGFHGGEQLVGTVQRAAARGHGYHVKSVITIKRCQNFTKLASAP